MKSWRHRLLATMVVSSFLGGVPVWAQQAPSGMATTPKPAATAPAPQAAGKININTADEATLTELNGIGKVKAQAIVAHRQKNGPFKTVDALADVEGIGPKTVDKLRDQLTIQ